MSNAEEKGPSEETGEVSRNAEPDFATELRFSDLISIALVNKRIVLSSVVALFVLALFYLKFATYLYSAGLQLTPVQQSTQQLDSRLSGLASIAGLNLSQEHSVSPFTLFVEGLNSRQTAEELAKNPVIMRTVFSNQWNENQSSWVRPSGAKAGLTRILKSLFLGSKTEWVPPGAAELESYLLGNVRVRQRPGESIVSIQFNHPDPEFARLLILELHKAADEFLRHRTLVRTDQYISYLTEQMSQVTIAEHRQALAAAFSEQEKLRMMADSGLPFAAEPFGPIAISSRPVSPRPGTVLVSSIILGALIGIGIVAIRYFLTEVK